MTRPAHYMNDYCLALKQQIKALPGEAFQRQDLIDDFSSNVQLRLTRALNAFASEGLIIKIAHGLYAKAKLLELPSGEIRPVPRKSFEAVTVEALNKLGIAWEYGRAIREYNQGKTQQVPVRFTIRLKTRFRREIATRDCKVYFEDDINTR